MSPLRFKNFSYLHLLIYCLNFFITLHDKFSAFTCCLIIIHKQSSMRQERKDEGRKSSLS